MHLLGKVKLILSSSCHPIVKNEYVYALHHIIYALHPLCIPYIYLCTHTYRIGGGSDTAGVRAQRRGDPTGDPTTGGSWWRRTGLGGVARVSWSKTLSLSERQAPEHSKYPMFYKCQLEFFMFYALGCRSWLETLDAYDLLVQNYVLKAYVGSGSNKCLAILSSVEVGWFSVTCEL